jgi:hypothetical protein
MGSLFGLLALVGCTGTAAPTVTETPSAPGSSPAATTTPSAPASSSIAAPTPSDSAKTIAITLADGKADPNGDRVELAKGTTLVLTVTADHADEVHVHGYDIEIEVTPGKPVRKEIVLDQVGRFEVESHEPQLTILQLVVS